MVRIRPAEKRDARLWAQMRHELWPDAHLDQLLEECEEFFRSGSKWIAAAFIAIDPAGTPLGFLEMNVRSVAEGCEHSPVPHVEGWYVVPNARRRGVGRALMSAAQTWAIERGYTEMTSDTTEEYPLSVSAHEASGFEIVERLIAFRKTLR